MTEADESKVTRPTAEAGAVEPVAMKPCPWCGGGVGPVVEEGARFRWRRVTGCCADGPEVRHDTMADDQAAAEVESRAAAIAAWNNRPAEDTLRAQLEAAEAGNHRRSDSEPTWAELTQHWKARAEAAEAECQRLSDGLTTIGSYKLRDFTGPHGMAINCVHVARETLAARTKEAAP